ncbi:MAG: sugar ABC transporter permease [Gammaproteobacteria bacterium]|nr:sugar ABC transporter permease [Gammaproteobacteria bacterium]
MTTQPDNLSRQDTAAAWVFILPAIAGLLSFVLLPFALALLLSFTNLRLGSPLPTEFMGWTQYQRIFTDTAFLRALGNNTLFALTVVPLQTVLALLLATLVNRPLRGMIAFRSLFFMPVVFPLSLVSVVWILMFAPGPQGTINSLLEFVTLGAWQPRDFLHDTFWALPAITLTSIWQGVGFQMVILLAALQSIPAELYEAAKVDGASGRQQFLHITLPQLRNALIFVVLVTTILAFRLFDQVQIMTQGGPQHATTTVMYEAVNAAFAGQQVARGAAMTVVFFTIVLLITLLQRYVLKHEKAIE